MKYCCFKQISFFLLYFLPTFHIHVHIIYHNHLPVVYKIYYYTYTGKKNLQQGYFFIPIQGRTKHTHTHPYMLTTHTQTHPYTHTRSPPTHTRPHTQTFTPMHTRSRCTHTHALTHSTPTF